MAQQRARAAATLGIRNSEFPIGKGLERWFRMLSLRTPSVPVTLVRGFPPEQQRQATPEWERVSCARAPQLLGLIRPSVRFVPGQWVESPALMAGVPWVATSPGRCRGPRLQAAASSQEFKLRNFNLRVLIPEWNLRICQE